MTQGEVTKKILLGQELPVAIAKEVFYLDAYNKIQNMLNFRNADLSSWKIEDYITSLFDDTLTWVNEQEDILSSEKTRSQLLTLARLPDKVLFSALVVSSIKRHEKQKPSITSDDPEAA